MAVGTVLATGAAAAGVRKIMDDLYAQMKEVGTNWLGSSRSDIKEQSISRALLAITKVKTLWNIEREVSLYDFYYPSKIEFNESVKKRINSIREFGSSGHFVVQGTAGQGKSIFLRFLCGQELRPELSSGRIPIFLELRRIRSDLSLPDLILQGLVKYKLPATAESWKYLASSGKFVLLLDAFDEIDPSLSGRALADIENLVDMHHDNLQIIITSRPDSDIQKSNHFRVFKLSQLTEIDHSPFLKKICTDKDQAESLLKVIKDSSSDVSGLLTTPLMMTLLVILYKSLQTIPDTVPKFYEELFDVLFYRHDHSKPGFRRKRFTQLDDGAVKKIFSALCFFARLHGLGVLTNQQLKECFDQASEASSIKFDAENVKQELIKTICLMQEEGFEISFIHKSVAQYYAASFVSESADLFAETFYGLAMKRPGWELELKFLAEIDSYRFNKLFELPLLRSFAYQLGISLDESTPGEVEKVNKYFIESLSMTAFFRNGIKPEDSKELDLTVGWSRVLSGPREPNNAIQVYDQLEGPWIKVVINALRTQRQNLPNTGMAQNLPSKMFPMSDYVPFIGEKMSLAGKAVLNEIRRRYASAINVVESEGRKTELLTAFMKRQ